jgi:type IV pilus assembly protein PilB
MDQLFPKRASTFDRLLLELLGHGGGLTAQMCEDALSRRRPEQPIELALLAVGLAPTQLLRGVLEAEARYLARLGPLYFGLRVLEVMPAEVARAHGIVPLVTHDTTILALTRPGAPAWQLIAHAERTWEVVQVGVVEDIDAELAAIGAQTARLHAGGATLPDYLSRRGLLRGRHATPAGPTDPEHWVQCALEDGAAEPEVYDAGAAFLDRPLLDASRAIALFEGPPLVDRAFVQAEGVFVLRVVAGHMLIAARRIPDPTTQETLMALAACHSVSGYVMRPSELERLLDHAYAAAPAAPALELAPLPEEDLPTSIDLSRLPGVANGLQALILQAIQQRASDIHIERYRQRVDVRFRIDGALQRIEAPWLTPQTAPAFLTKVKVEAHLDIAERRRPQDGVIRRRLADRKIDIRVAIQPTLWGENAVLRILDPRAGAPGLDQLGFEPAVLAELRRLVHNPQGLILLAGPTGCGKTSTLYAVLRELLRDELKIVTAEDPIEYAIDGVQQSQVNDAIGDTFDRYLRAFLRQDPDVILVGEIRDAITAESAVRAAQTGHLVLSTLHVNDAQGAVRRLIDLGVTPSLVSQTLLCVVSQRLSRRVCRDCGRADTPDPALVRELYPAGPPPDARFARGQGCGSCHDTGYRGRAAIVELWRPDRETRGLIDRGATTEALIDQALAMGMRSLVSDATDKAASGITTLEELRAVLSCEQIARHQETARPRPRARTHTGG